MPRPPRRLFTIIDDPWVWGLMTVGAVVHAVALIWVDAPRWLSVGMGLPMGMCGWMWWTSVRLQRPRRRSGTGPRVP